MATRLEIDPITGALTFTADTPEEAARFAAEYAAKKATTGPSAPPPKSSPATGRTPAARAARREPQLRIDTRREREWDAETASRYLGPLGGRSLAFISVLTDRAVVDSDEMALSIASPVNVMGPIVRTLTTQAKTIGMGAPFTTELLKPNGKRYHINGSFRAVAPELLAAKKRAA